MTADDQIERCYRTQYRRFVGVVAVVTGSLALAEEAVQEAFARAVVKERDGRLIDDVPAWVVTVALNQARSGRRKATSERRALDQLARAPRSERSVDDDAAVVLRAAIAELAQRQREAVVLYYLLDMDVASVARALGVSSGTVKTALSRARHRLAVLLADEELTT